MDAGLDGLERDRGLDEKRVSSLTGVVRTLGVLSGLGCGGPFVFFHRGPLAARLKPPFQSHSRYAVVYKR